MDELLQIVSDNLLDIYKKEVEEISLKKYLNAEDSGLSIESFSFYTSVAAVYSSKIEGENIEMDSYVKYKRFGTPFQPDYTRKTDDLYNAYEFAKSNALNKNNIEKAHAILSQHLLQTSRQGSVRKNIMYVLAPNGEIEYVAAAPDNVEKELTKFYADLEHLLHKKLTLQEVFYYAAYLHLVFVKIHSFEDGNGRISRLIEKWFLAAKLRSKAWFIESEKFYYENHQDYYSNLRSLGLEYETLDYSACLPFLKMLAQSVH